MTKYVKIILKQFNISRDFKEKLRHNYHELTWLERALYITFFRPSFPKENRFFYEGCKKILGQMYIADRKGLYQAIIKYKPKSCFEVGTYTGGGSTFFLASAFYKLGQGKLYTLENDKRLFEKAVCSYRKYLPNLTPYVKFLYGDSIENFKPYFPRDGIDCVFLDGAEDGMQTMNQFLKFQDFLKPGAILMAHDWNTEKTSQLKPYLLSNRDWEVIEEINPPLSVGFVVLKKVK